ncbi:GNAT family N-acetyltransferase [Aerococcus vaginalis]
MGYSVHPDERQKGYATEILQHILAICRAIGESEILLTCDKRNIASRKTIQNNGGVLIDELEESNGRITQRFRIALQK